VFEILDIGYRADFFDVVGAPDGVDTDNETAALEREFAFGLRDDPIEVGFADGDRFHRAFGWRQLFSRGGQALACGKLSRSAAPPQLCPGAPRGIASFSLPVARPRCRK
jgi:hypothetical protein